MTRQHIHARMLLAHDLAVSLRLLQPPQNRTLLPLFVQMPLFPIENQSIRTLRDTVLAPSAGSILVLVIAELVIDTIRLFGFVAGISVPFSASGALPVDAILLVLRDAVTEAGVEAGDVGVFVSEAEVIEDEGHVSVLVVVVEFQIVGFGVALLVRNPIFGGAEAEAAEEEVRAIGGLVAAGETFDSALFDLTRGEGEV